MASGCREFQEDAFLPFVGPAFQALTDFLQSAEEFNTQIQASTHVLLLPGSPWGRGSLQWLPCNPLPTYPSLGSEQLHLAARVMHCTTHMPSAVPL